MYTGFFGRAFFPDFIFCFAPLLVITVNSTEFPFSVMMISQLDDILSLCTFKCPGGKFLDVLLAVVPIAFGGDEIVMRACFPSRHVCDDVEEIGIVDPLPLGADASETDFVPELDAMVGVFKFMIAPLYRRVDLGHGASSFRNFFAASPCHRHSQSQTFPSRYTLHVPGELHRTTLHFCIVLAFAIISPPACRPSGLLPSAFDINVYNTYKGIGIRKKKKTRYDVSSAKN